MWCRSERSKRSRRILFGCLWCKCRKRIAPPHSPFFLSVFLTLSLLCISEPIGAAQRRVTQISAEAKTGCLVETETIAEILQNPSDTPSATHTQMARKNRKWSHRAAPSPSLACYCRSQPIPWQITSNKRELKERGRASGGRVTETVSNYNYANVPAGQPISAVPPPPLFSPSVPQMVIALIIRSCD